MLCHQRMNEQPKWEEGYILVHPNRGCGREQCMMLSSKTGEQRNSENEKKKQNQLKNYIKLQWYYIPSSYRLQQQHQQLLQRFSLLLLFLLYSFYSFVKKFRVLENPTKKRWKKFRFVLYFVRSILFFVSSFFLHLCFSQSLLG